MSVPQHSPALPWGSGQKEHSAGQTDDMRAVSLDQLGLSLGDRIEVKWQVQPDEGEPVERWWGARISAAQPTAASSGSPAYTIKYDTWPECDFTEEEEGDVALLSTHRLLDVRQQEVMAWRREGDDYEPESESEEEEGEDGAQSGDAGLAGVEAAEGGSVSIEELAAGVSDADVSAEELRLASAPQHVAQGYKDFMDNLKQFILAKASQAEGDGQGPLITTADVAEFKAMMMTQAAGRGRTHRAA